MKTVNCNYKLGEPDDPRVITQFLRPDERIETIRGWFSALEWLMGLQARDMRGIPTEIVRSTCGRIALRRVDRVAA